METKLNQGTEAWKYFYIFVPMPINRNNMLRWNGSFTPAMVDNIAVADGPILLPSSDVSVTCPVLFNDSATLGINTESVTILSYSSPCQLPAEFDTVTNLLTIYRPVDPTVSSLTLTYQWADYCGNVSNTATITVNVLTAATAWVAYESSYYCVLNTVNGQNTGFANWTQQVLTYSPSGTPVTPLTLRPNALSLGIADYIGDVLDPITCPSSAALNSPVNVSNFVNRPTSYPQAFITITQLNVNYGGISPYDGSSGFPNIVYACSIGPGGTQQFLIPGGWAGAAIDISVTFTVGGPGGSPWGANYNWLDFFVNTNLITPYQGYFTSAGGSPIPGAFLAPTGATFDFGSINLNYPAGCTLYIA